MLKTLAIATAITVGLTGAGMAKVLNWTATLDQAHETKAKDKVAAAAGTASGTIDTVKHRITWEVSYSGLSGAATGMHFHGPAKVGKNAGVVVNIGKDSGLKSPSKGSAKISAKAIGQIEKGLWYVNVHTKKNPGGEIRGQVMVQK